MVSSTLVKLSSPVARSSLIGISVALFIDAVLTIYSAIQYPQMTDEYYITSSRTISIVYSGIALVAILISVSTAVASYKNATNYVLIHAGITGVFLPISILAYFSMLSSRYKVHDYFDSYKKMIDDYRISGSHIGRSQQKIDQDHDNKIRQSFVSTVFISDTKITLSSFFNSIDSIQTKFSCCGVESVQDWIKRWDDYIAPSCCTEQSSGNNSHWATLFDVDKDHLFQHCKENDSYLQGCLVVLKESEQSKYTWLSDLIVFMMVITITNTIVSLLLFGLSKTEDNSFEGQEHELSIVGASSKPRPTQPTITSIKPRLSVVHTLGISNENLNARAQAVRFNISNSPRASISGPSKFSAGARRGSSFI